MTHFALHLKCACMHLMAERDRLLAQQMTRGDQKQNDSPQRFPFRISSAMYSDARMESDKIVMVGF